MDGDEAHLVLQFDLMTTVPGVNIEVPIPGSSISGNTGYADIVYNNGVKTEVYEIKPGSYAPDAINNLLGKAQLNRYIDNYPGIAVPGTSLNPIISTKLYPSSLHPEKKIKYYTYSSNPGMIYWGYINKPETEPESVYETETIPEVDNKALETVGKFAVGAGIVWGLYEIVKWGATIIAAPATGGGSLVGAGCLP